MLPPFLYLGYRVLINTGKMPSSLASFSAFVSEKVLFIFSTVKVSDQWGSELL